MEPLSRYQWAKSINVCPQCLKRRPKKGKTTCEVCLKKRRETVAQRKASISVLFVVNQLWNYRVENS